MRRHHHRPPLLHLPSNLGTQCLPFTLALTAHDCSQKTRQTRLQRIQSISSNRPTRHHWKAILHSDHSRPLFPSRKTPAPPPYPIRWAPRSLHNRCHASHHTENQGRMESWKSCHRTLPRHTSSVPQHSQRPPHPQHEISQSPFIIRQTYRPNAYRQIYPP